MLRILASKDELPPSIVGAQGTSQGIVLKFRKPMDPTGASNVNNDSVQNWKSGRGRHIGGSGVPSFSLSSLYGKHSSHSGEARLRNVKV
ncbi:MAG: hypothetical protein NVSMB9_25970 [Isosphaeraceae bacterium]